MADAQTCADMANVAPASLAPIAPGVQGKFLMKKKKKKPKPKKNEARYEGSDETRKENKQ